MKAQPEYLEAKDWFRDGQDRFYLVHGTSNEKIGTGPKVYGNHSLYGIGCFREPADIKKHPHLLERAQVSIANPAQSDFKIIAPRENLWVANLRKDPIIDERVPETRVADPSDRPEPVPVPGLSCPSIGFTIFVSIETIRRRRWRPSLTSGTFATIQM